MLNCKKDSKDTETLQTYLSPHISTISIPTGSHSEYLPTIHTTNWQRIRTVEITKCHNIWTLYTPTDTSPFPLCKAAILCIQLHSITYTLYTHTAQNITPIPIFLTHTCPLEFLLFHENRLYIRLFNSLSRGSNNDYSSVTEWVDHVIPI